MLGYGSYLSATTLSPLRCSSVQTLLEAAPNTGVYDTILKPLFLFAVKEKEKEKAGKEEKVRVSC